MVTIHQRWEREQKRIAKNDWLTYQWEDLVKLLSQDRKNYLQKEVLSIRRFKNDEGQKLGRKYGPKQKWVGYRERLKPFYIYRNKIMVLWIPEHSKKTGGRWEVLSYRKDGLKEIKQEDFNWALERNLYRMFGNAPTTGPMADTYRSYLESIGWHLDNNTYVPRRARVYKPTDRLRLHPAYQNSIAQTGGSMLSSSPNSIGSSQFPIVDWDESGELKNLTNAKKFAENLWKFGDVIDSSLRWMRERDVGPRYSEQIQAVDNSISGDDNWMTSIFYNYAPLTTNDDLLEILTRPVMGFIINWHNYAPNV